MQTFIYTDPRTYDGDPFEAAALACAQAEAIARIAAQATQDAFIMARNAEMERQIIATGKPDPVAFELGPHGRHFTVVKTELEVAAKSLKTLGKAAGFDPRAPLGKD